MCAWRQRRNRLLTLLAFNESNRPGSRGLAERPGREPVILHEQAHGGRTIIEKFEAHAVTAGFAVVLLIADDVGHANGGDERPWARQNVVLRRATSLRCWGGYG
jgi:Predicted nucleotide-binding protein containing TIR-like domain